MLICYTGGTVEDASRPLWEPRRRAGAVAACAGDGAESWGAYSSRRWEPPAPTDTARGKAPHMRGGRRIVLRPSQSRQD